jgi:hypothetical protein
MSTDVHPFPAADRLHLALERGDIDAPMACWHDEISYAAPGTRANGREERVAVERARAPASLASTWILERSTTTTANAISYLQQRPEVDAERIEIGRA